MGRITRSFCALTLCLMLALGGCRPTIRVSAEPVPAYVATEQPSPEPTPVPVNPVAVCFGGFSRTLEPIRAEIAKNTGYMEYSLLLDMHYQRLQHFFLDVSKLAFSGDGLWEGVLVGAINGSGSIYAEGNGYRFSCSLWDTTKQEGSIDGGIMTARWLYQEDVELERESYTLDDGQVVELAPNTRTVWHEFRSVEIRAEDGGFLVLTNWDEEHTLMFVTEGALYFTDEPPDELSGTDWAKWSFTHGRLTLHEPEDIENETVQEVVPDEL